MRNALLMLIVLLVAACVPQGVTNTTNDTLGNETPIPEDSSTAAPAEEEEQAQEPTPRSFAAEVQFTEGDLVRLQTRATDPDGDDVEIVYGDPLTPEGTWKTQIGDAGDYNVHIVATDEHGAITEQDIKLTILHANRAPQLQSPDELAVREGEEVTIPVTATDPDGDEIILSFSGWMQSDSYTTDYDDAGVHNVTVIAEDGKLSAQKTIVVTVENVNRAPQLELPQQRYETTELEPITIDARATDPDGDEVKVSFSEPLNAEGSWTPALDDDGEYTVTITATDGTETVTQTATLLVNRANRAPTIRLLGGADELRYAEGDFIDLRRALTITDEEGEEVVVTYSGWMRGATYQTTYDDAGTHTVSVTAGDGSGHTITQDIRIVVENTNRAPIFTRPA